MSATSARPPVRRTPLSVALLAVLATACTSGGSGAVAPSPSTAAPPTAEQLCARLVTHWALDRLRPDGGTGADYQQMGLSDGQNTILLEAVERARARQRAHGPAAGRAEARRVVAQRCAERHTA